MYDLEKTGESQGELSSRFCAMNGLRRNSMAYFKPDQFDDADEAQAKLRELQNLDGQDDTENLSEKELKKEIQKFLRGKRKNDPRLDQD